MAMDRIRNLRYWEMLQLLWLCMTTSMPLSAVSLVQNFGNAWCLNKELNKAWQIFSMNGKEHPAGARWQWVLKEFWKTELVACFVTTMPASCNVTQRCLTDQFWYPVKPNFTHGFMLFKKLSYTSLPPHNVPLGPKKWALTPPFILYLNKLLGSGLNRAGSETAEYIRNNSTSWAWTKTGNM